MLSYNIEINEYGIHVLRVRHRRDSLEYELSDLYKEDETIYSLFKHINEYVQSFPKTVQARLFDIFATLDSGEKLFADIQYTYMLEEKIAEVVEILNWSKFKTWLYSKQSELKIPDSVEVDYVKDQDLNTTADKTYVLDEYLGLISYITFTRALAPMYLDYYNYIKQVTRHHYYKLFMLFVRSDLYSCYEIEKLRSYIVANQESLAPKHEGLIFGVGVSDDDAIDSLVGEIIFHKLSTIDFTTREHNIISFVFTTIRYKSNHGNTGPNSIRGSSTVIRGQENDASYFEEYRKTSDISIGTVIELQHALSNTEAIVNSLGYTDFDYDLYDRELKNYLPEFLATNPSKLQIYLLGWFLGGFINPRALSYIEARKVAELLLLAKVVLLQQEHFFMAMFLSSYRTDFTTHINVIVKNVLDKNLVAELKDSYSYIMGGDKTSIIENTITETGKEMSNSVWVPIGLPKGMENLISQEGYLLIPSDINDQICKYIKLVNN